MYYKVLNYFHFLFKHSYYILDNVLFSLTNIFANRLFKSDFSCKFAMNFFGAG
jgi:hypothetical protein